MDEVTQRAGPATPAGELNRYARLLWNVAPPLLPRIAPLDGEIANPSLSNLGLHLPLRAGAVDAPRDWCQAASAHAVAHLVYSRERFDAKSMKPITRALVGLLEDARVEGLACRELPGLRALFFGDAEGCTVLLRSAADVRAAASRLGHDIGQMRLPFNPRLYVVTPDYRDDHAVLWRSPERAKPAGAEAPDATAGSVSASAAAPPEADTGAEVTAVAHLYPEWDRLIGRHRLRWCTVLEQAPGDPAPHVSPTGTVRPRHAPTRTERTRRHEDGDDLDLPAAIDAGVDLRQGRTPDTRVYASWRRHPVVTLDLWLLDLSASTSPALLRRMRETALAAADAASRAGTPCAIDGFRSCGRHEVHYLGLKRFDEPMSNALDARLAALQGEGSTRLGAALRHATRRLLPRPTAAAGLHRRLFVITDGDPYDIDIHDPRYLVEDACRAVQEARRGGVEVIGVASEPGSAAALRRIFGTRGYRL